MAFQSDAKGALEEMSTAGAKEVAEIGV